MRPLALTALLALVGCGTSSNQNDAGSAGGGGSTSNGGGTGTGGGTAAGGGISSGGGTATGGGTSTGGGIATGGGSGGDAGAPELQVTPDELIFSGVKGTLSAPKTVTLDNPGPQTLAIPVSLTGAAQFRFDPTIPATLTVDAGSTATLSVRFSPDAGTVGELSAVLHVGDAGVGLYALATKGEQGNNEPPLQACFDVLGFDIDAGSSNLIIGTGAAPVGDEVILTLFHAADGGDLGIKPVARYSPDETLPFGWYRPLTDGGADLHFVGTIAMGQDQTLNPGLVPDSGSDFSPGTDSFGIFVHSNSFNRNTYTEDPRNTGPTVHACRVYPVKNRQGVAVPNAYVIGFEDAANGDYQDYVFELTNAKP